MSGKLQGCFSLENYVARSALRNNRRPQLIEKFSTRCAAAFWASFGPSGLWVGVRGLVGSSPVP